MPISRAEPRPVPVRRYRYSRWRWRILVHVIDAIGGLVASLARLGRRAPNWAAPRRILLVQLDHLGDSVLSSPLFPRLRAAWPEARIDVLASPSNRTVFEADPHVDRVHVAERNWFERANGRRAMLSAVWQLGRALRDQQYDLGIDVRGDVLSILVLALARIPRRVGWTMGGGGFLLTDIAPWRPDRHEVESRLALLDALGLSNVLPDEPVRVSVHVTRRDRARVARLLFEAWPEDLNAPSEPAVVSIGEHAEQSSASAQTGMLRLSKRHSEPPTSPTESDDDSLPLDEETLHAGRFGDEAPLLAVHLGAGTSAKRWPIRHWSWVIHRFLEEGWRVVLVGGPEDREAATRLPAHPNLRDWIGRLRVTETTALLERADLFLGADSGPAHLAACAGVPSVILFSGTNRVAQWRPWSRRSLVLKHRVPCRPCHNKTCPLAGHPCMTGLTPDRVYRAARRWWARLHRLQSPYAPL